MRKCCGSNFQNTQYFAELWAEHGFDGAVFCCFNLYSLSAIKCDGKEELGRVLSYMYTHKCVLELSNRRYCHLSEIFNTHICSCCVICCCHMLLSYVYVCALQLVVHGVYATTFCLQYTVCYNN